jgi:hypothetical protein
MFSTQLIVDADWTAEGWEIVVRFDADSMEAAWSGVSDADLPGLIGEAMADAVAADRDNKAMADAITGRR